jgi:ribosome-associated protein
VAKLTREALLREFSVSAVRSSGPGGQHANKVSTRVEVRWNVQATALLTPEEKLRFAKRLTAGGDLVVTAQETRSQATNKERAIARMLTLIGRTLATKKKRKATAPSQAAVRSRLEAKRQKSEKKSRRGKIIRSDPE